ncbi:MULTISPECIES: SRPBCC domain-containing protein [unclassified Cryobacterium]|uniref:SRPBCC family protein n=1 Tax=unclassified Cryobacterium TaxID=2649013 RepID=UPI000CE50138|nr:MULTISPECIES: SRPBCC family protein [unclassified Cryobacterium]TFD57554.1 SRPBCC family protein [Cryobacterium sp. Hh38]
MAVNYRKFRCTPEQVFAVLHNGWLYPTWVVGASRMRDVDTIWPAVGSRLHHSVGVWPALLDDSTSVLEWQAPRHALLQARGWPIGEAHVSIDIQDHPNGCLVRMTEDVVAGPARLVPTTLSDLAIRYRNSETLRRLAYLAEGHAD